MKDTYKVTGELYITVCTDSGTARIHGVARASFVMDARPTARHAAGDDRAPTWQEYADCQAWLAGIEANDRVAFAEIGSLLAAAGATEYEAKHALPRRLKAELVAWAGERKCSAAEIRLLTERPTPAVSVGTLLKESPSLAWIERLPHRTGFELAGILRRTAAAVAARDVPAMERSVLGDRIEEAGGERRWASPDYLFVMRGVSERSFVVDRTFAVGDEVRYKAAAAEADAEPATPLRLTGISYSAGNHWLQLAPDGGRDFLWRTGVVPFATDNALHPDDAVGMTGEVR